MWVKVSGRDSQVSFTGIDPYGIFAGQYDTHFIYLFIFSAGRYIGRSLIICIEHVYL